MNYLTKIEAQAHARGELAVLNSYGVEALSTFVEVSGTWRCQTEILSIPESKQNAVDPFCEMRDIIGKPYEHSLLPDVLAYLRCIHGDEAFDDNPHYRQFMISGLVAVEMAKGNKNPAAIYERISLSWLADRSKPWRTPQENWMLMPPWTLQDVEYTAAAINGNLRVGQIMQARSIDNGSGQA